ncbi:MAG: LPS-assembly protein LptD [Bacteroidales bacterium]|nr:LPS-assembly protein LptD [Bacteroidales bacterium]
MSRQKHSSFDRAPWVAVAAAILLVVLSSFTGYQSPQKPRRNRGKEVQPAFTQYVMKDTTSVKDSLTEEDLARLDSLAVADSIARVDSVNMLGKSSLTQPAFSQARDSLIEDFSNGRQMLYYYGDVTVKYGNLELSADYMEYDVQAKTVYAKGTKDSLGVVTGSPVMKQGDKSYEMEELRYNFDSGKARITNMTTHEDDGILHGQNIKMMPDKSINITDGKYTVCDCEHPHYYLHLTAAKVMTKPSQKTVFGPAIAVVEDVPLPLAIPFGFIPKTASRATGFLMPSFGEEAARGFYLRDAGMYFVIGDYFDISMTGDYYTLGSWAANINSRYKVNYKCNGNFGLSISNNQTGEKGSADFFQSRDFSVKWSHSQDSKARPGTSFSASVNFSSPSNNRFNSTSVTEALQNSISSSISYSKNWDGKFNLSVNALHNQNSRDSSYAFTLPNISFSVSRFYPFKRKNRVGKEKAYEKFSLGYNTSFQNKINFKASEFGQPGFYDKFKNGMNHNFQIGLPNFTLLKYLNFTPSISYGMNWFFDSTKKEFDPEQNKVVDKTGGMFSTFGTTHTYSGSMSMSTRLYGLFQFGNFHKIQAIRHVVSPSLSLSYSPEKGTAFNGWRTLTYTDTTGVEKSLDYNIYAGQLNSPPGKGRTGSLSIQIGNNLEAKVRDLRDTTGAGVKKVKLLDQLNFSTSYNMLADSLKMSNVGVTASTQVFGKLGLNGNLNFDPYAVNEKGQKFNRFAIQEGQGLLRLMNASFSTSYSFQGKGESHGDAGGSGESYQRIYYHPVTGEYIPGGYVYYMNTSSPWSVNFNFSYNYSKQYQYANEKLVTKHNHNMTLGFSGNVKLTKAMSINATSGWDFKMMKLSTTQFSATYDLHCFNIAVSWVPTGTWQSWSFRIAANASALSDLLKYKKSSSYWDN